MDTSSGQWSKIVFRLRGLPNRIKTLDGTAIFLSGTLGDTPTDSIRVFSLATTLSSHERPPSKVATVMFSTVPAMVALGYDKNEWNIPPGEGRLILDTHFNGMTPLNDVPPTDHLHDCIALSGLASHPFGSWQPKGEDKTFMWIRDNLPNHLKSVRAVVYGHDTKLHDSQSFQSIQDLAHKLIDQLLAYGWKNSSAKPIAFLAHSLGGLVLKEALIQLDKSQDQAYKTLLTVIQGAVFFGVPNLGMEQAHFRTVVRNNPNEALVDDIGRNSNYLRRLNEAFNAASFGARLKCFWAFETSESPTLSRTKDGKIDRNGPRAILVSRESATCRYIDTDRSATFPIDETHSDMVKFTRNSHYYDVVIDKLSHILQIMGEVKSTTDDAQNTCVYGKSKPSMEAGVSPSHPPTTEGSLEPSITNMTTSLATWDRKLMLTEDEKFKFMRMTSDVMQAYMHELQTEQEMSGRLMYMKRLEPFLVAMKQFEQALESHAIFDNSTEAMAYVWGPMEYIVRTASSFTEGFHSVLDGYQIIGEQIPLLHDFQSISRSHPHLKETIVMVYDNILEFQLGAMKTFRKRQWQKLFSASWRHFTTRVEQIKENLSQVKRLIENRVSIHHFEMIRTDGRMAEQAFSNERATDYRRSRGIVMQWLSPFNSNAEQDRYREERSICKDPGRWLLNDVRFQQWFGVENHSAPLLWLSGIPGAGKTILASVIIDAARALQGSTVAFFYCKHGDGERNSFIGVARSILAQIHVQNPHLLPYFHEQASISGDAMLTSTSVAKEMLGIAIESCEKLYIIIDGVDECKPKERKEVASWFQTILRSLAETRVDPPRCLFVSQDDGVARGDFRDLPAIKITDENRDDIVDFATVWQEKVERKFGPVQSHGHRVGRIISTRSGGMFIFAELFSKYLEAQLNRDDLLKELDPSNLPVKLDHVYQRIIHRIFESRADNTVPYIKKIMGWIACAKRPLRWREIQAAVSIDLENQKIDFNKKLSGSPKDLFASLIELKEDGTVELVHGTAREYLLRNQIVSICDADYSLSILGIGYLTFSEMELNLEDEDIRAAFLKGAYAFYDYASACWAMHLPNAIAELKDSDDLAYLKETLEIFIDSHWSLTCKPLQDTKRLKKSLGSLESSEHFDRIVQAVAWARRQSGEHGRGPSPDEALDFRLLTERIRSILELMKSSSLSPTEEQALQHFYGQNLFKCPRINCHRYYNGFETAQERKQHVDKHERPFLCIVSGCYMKDFGYVTEQELKRHLFETHAIDMLGDADEVQYPDPIKEKVHNTAKKDATFKCTLCGKAYTRNHNLKNHMRSHDGSKPFSCGTCDQRFTRKDDCARHERGHGEKKFICSGPLKDGGSWGCRSAFGRADKLADHLKSKTGRKCIQPLMLEKLHEEGGTEQDEDNIFASQQGENADKLQAAGRSLPSFRDLLQQCGLAEDV